MVSPYDEKTFEEFYFQHLPVAYEQGKAQTEWIVNNFDFQSYLEIGLGQGVLFKLMKERKQATGVEFSKWAIKNLYPDMGIVNSPVWDMKELTESSDLVLCFDVLHLIPIEEREKAAREISRLCKKWLLVNIPCQPFNLINTEPWILQPQDYEAAKTLLKLNLNINSPIMDKIKSTPVLVKFETREYWKELFENHGFREVELKGLPNHSPLYFFVFKKDL